MKKLMFAAAAVMGISAAFAIESANIVGYATPANTVAGGNRMIGPMFIKVGQQTEGSGTYSVQDIVPTGAVIPNGNADDIKDPTKCLYLQKLTSSGATDGAPLYWRDGSFKSGKSTIDFHGWYTDGGKTPADVSLTTGQGVWMYFPATADCSFTFSGEVPSEDVYMALNQNNTAVCNPMPASISVQTIEPHAAPGATVPDGNADDIKDPTKCLYLQKLTASGATDGAPLYWRDGSFKSGKSTILFHGWYTDGGKTPAEMTLAPGEGLWMYCPNTGISLRFQSVLN